MTDTAEAAIATIHARLDVLAGSHVTYEIGEKARLKNAAPVRIDWVYAPGALAPPDLVGGNPKQVATDVAAFVVHIWHNTREDCRLLFHGLVTAAHDVGYGHNVRWGRYDWIGERSNLKKGCMLAANVTVRCPAYEPREGSLNVAGVPEMPMTDQTHQVSVNGEIVC